jgi:hypothetical protein
MKLPHFLRLLLAASLAARMSTFAVEPPKTPPDLTVDQQQDRKKTYNLGPTGMRGWIYTRISRTASRAGQRR